MESSTTNGDGHRGDQRVRTTMRIKTVATVGALVSYVLASRRNHSLVGASPPGSTQQVRFARAIAAGGGQRRRGCTRMHTKGNERNGRTNGTTTKAAGDYSVVGAAPPGSMQQVRFANGSRGGRAAALGVHTGAREGERQERTHKRNEHEFGPISTPLTGYNVLYGAVKRPDKHSPHGQCAIRCREEAR